MIKIVSDSILDIITRKPGVSRKTIYTECEHERLYIAKGIHHLLANDVIKNINDSYWLYKTAVPVSISKPIIYITKSEVIKETKPKKTYSTKPRKPNYSNEKQSDVFDILTRFGGTTADRM